MPEIAEVARITHFLRIHLVGQKVTKVIAPDDANVFGKVGTSGPAFEAAVNGKKVISAGSQGKYFWITLERPPHVVMHFGMTGWIHIRGEQTAYTNYYNKMKEEEKVAWPPKHWKFLLETEGKDKVEVAFTDPRRFGRVRLVDCPGEDIRKHSPLKENGPDPVVDMEIFTVDFLKKKMRSRHVPIKALLLDQTQISGIGNWVADEVLFQSRLHPEQHCDEFDENQIKKLYDAIRHVCQTAVDCLGDSDKFPKDWLFEHRWGKGGNGATSTLPNGEKLAYIVVGSRTTCYAPGLQKKTGRVVPSAKTVPMESGQEVKSVEKLQRGVKKPRDSDHERVPPLKKTRTTKASLVAKLEPKIKREAECVSTTSSNATEPQRRRSSRIKK